MAFDTSLWNEKKIRVPSKWKKNLHPKQIKKKWKWRINGAPTYNTLLRIIRQVDTLSEFKIKLKRHFKQ